VTKQRSRSEPTGTPVRENRIHVDTPIQQLMGGIQRRQQISNADWHDGGLAFEGVEPVFSQA
jgi:hypothetical protein